MSGGREYTKGQRKIIKRHYETAEPRAVQRLQEVVSELYVAESDSAANRLWKSAATALKNLNRSDARAQQILEERDLGELAALVAELT